MNFVRDKTKQNLVGEKKSFAFDYQRNEKASKGELELKFLMESKVSRIDSSFCHFL